MKLDDALMTSKLYVRDAKILFADRFPGQSFDASSWDVSHLKKSRHCGSNARVYFTRNGSTTDPLPTVFSDIVKSYVLCTPGVTGTMNLRANMARMLWQGIESRIGMDSRKFRWEDISEQDLLQTEQVMLSHWGKALTHKQCGKLKHFIRTLGATPHGPLVPLMDVDFRTPRQEDFERYTIAGQESRQEKMPPDEAIFAIGDMFSDKSLPPDERLTLCVLAILMATSCRVGEVLTLPFDCIVSEPSEGEERYGVRFHKEKSKGGEKQLAVRWLTSRQAELVQAAVAEATQLTSDARARAQVLESDPRTIPLPGVTSTCRLTRGETARLIGCLRGTVSGLIRNGRLLLCDDDRVPATSLMSYLHSIRGSLWVVDLNNGRKQSLSESLFIQFLNAGHVGRGTNRLLVEPLEMLRINDFLGGRTERGQTCVRSAFELYGHRDRNGSFFSMSSHQFRHWATTKAARVGVPDQVISRWQGREHVEELQAYKHFSTAERVEALKAALQNGSVKGELSQMYFALHDDIRDIFLDGAVQAVHVTPLGLCVHDFKVAPCPKFLNCVKGCSDYLLDTSNHRHIQNLVQLEIRTHLTLDQALQQQAAHEADLSENWIREGQETLRGLRNILDEAHRSAPGLIEPFRENLSRFANARDSYGAA